MEEQKKPEKTEQVTLNDAITPVKKKVTISPQFIMKTEDDGKTKKYIYKSPLASENDEEKTLVISEDNDENEKEKTYKSNIFISIILLFSSFVIGLIGFFIVRLFIDFTESAGAIFVLYILLFGLFILLIFGLIFGGMIVCQGFSIYHSRQAIKKAKSKVIRIMGWILFVFSCVLIPLSLIYMIFIFFI